MIARDPNQRRLYGSRLKAERDSQSKEEYAREEGFEQGREQGRLEGEAIGKVKLLQQSLGTDSSSDTDLRRLALEDLARIEQDLQRRLRERS